ncbi:MAG: VanZ family protein [Candidatus Electryonea clarkiae]|nr:VanZ family protein [Candidatus Electryonea clarkiae]MDP8288855.1 VanZ family protein [Candidatus Electryonea clarkiae]
MFKIRSWIPAAIWAIVIFALSAIPQNGYSRLYSISWVKAILEALPFQPDKAIHFLLYFFLSLFIVSWFRQSYPHFYRNLLKYAFLTWIISVTYGITDEFHQFFVPGRDMELFDLLADGTGAFAGIVLFYLGHLVYSKKFVNVR